MRQRNPLAVRDLEALKKRVENSKRIVPHSVRSLAREAGIGHAAVGHLLTGERTTVSEAVAERLSAALGVSVDDLFVPTPSLPSDTDEGSEI